VRSRRIAELRQNFPSRDLYTVSGLILGDICFSCECRILELGGEEGVVLAWCECGWPDDWHEMEVLEGTISRVR
jgi:hypothetical protein